MSSAKNHFWYRNGEGFCESVALAKIAREVGTPAYVYSKAALAENCHELKAAFSSYPTLACYAVKANTNHTLLKEIFSIGFGADVVSVGELERALAAGARPEQIVFSGVGKQDHEIARALDVGILSFNVESIAEVETLREISKQKKAKASVMLRLNPNIDVKTNPYIATGLYSTKFGIAEEEAMEVARHLLNDEDVSLVGLSCHLGSQIFETRPYTEAAGRMVTLAGECQAMGHPIQFLDLGGGYAIQYEQEAPPPMEDYAKSLISAVRKSELRLLIEPGRSLVGNTGILLTQVVLTKETPKKHFVVVDAAMNDVIRPSLYHAYHPILPVVQQQDLPVKADVVGPICETGDLLGSDRKLPLLYPKDLLMIQCCGAYCASMASNYNSRPRAVEVLVDGASFKVIRPRESLQSLWQSELKPSA